MNRVQLIFEGISDIVGGNGLAVIILTDMERTRSISIVCDDVIKRQIALRGIPEEKRSKFLPEVMTCMLEDNINIKQYEIFIHDIVDGEYKATVCNTVTLCEYGIRLSDAILLSRISKMPIYIDNKLMIRQSSPYRENSGRMAIPINSLATEKLKEELIKAIETENYRLASQIKEELDKRKQH